MGAKNIASALAFTLTLALALGQSAVGRCESDIVKSFTEALENNDTQKSAAVIKDNKDKIPDEIKGLLSDAAKPETTKEEKEARFYLAELIARGYKDLTNNAAPLIEVKRVAFDARLSKPMRSEAKDGVHTVNTAKSVFEPDNITIKIGETVKWTNNDDVPHIFSSMPLIGAGGIFSPSVPPGQTWEFKFAKPGEYYYICFIHRGMIGKVTVE